MLELLKIEKKLISTSIFSAKYLITITNKETNYSTNFTYSFYDCKEPDDVYILNTLIDESRYGYLSFTDFMNSLENFGINDVDFLIEEHNHCVLLKDKLSNLYPDYLKVWSVI